MLDFIMVQACFFDSATRKKIKNREENVFNIFIVAYLSILYDNQNKLWKQDQNRHQNQYSND